MAQIVDEDEIDDIQYFCHDCDAIVADIEYTDDGNIQCGTCNGMSYFYLISELFPNCDHIETK